MLTTSSFINFLQIEFMLTRPPQVFPDEKPFASFDLLISISSFLKPVDCHVFLVFYMLQVQCLELFP
ncbi:hypothetical protein D3C87_946050 [compost metagenome]